MVWKTYGPPDVWALACDTPRRNLRASTGSAAPGARQTVWHKTLRRRSLFTRRSRQSSRQWYSASTTPSTMARKGGRPPTAAPGSRVIARLALQAQLGKNLRQASMVTKTSPLSRDCCMRKNNGLCNIRSHACMAGPPYFATPYVPVIVIQGRCKPLITNDLWLTVNFRVFAPGGPIWINWANRKVAAIEKMLSLVYPIGFKSWWEPDQGNPNRIFHENYSQLWSAYAALRAALPWWKRKGLDKAWQKYMVIDYYVQIPEDEYSKIFQKGTHNLWFAHFQGGL